MVLLPFVINDALLQSTVLCVDYAWMERLMLSNCILDS